MYVLGKSAPIFPFYYGKLFTVFPVFFLYSLLKDFVILEGLFVDDSAFPVVLLCVWHFGSITHDKNMHIIESWLQKDGLDGFIDDNCIGVRFYGGSSDDNR